MYQDYLAFRVLEAVIDKIYGLHNLVLGELGEFTSANTCYTCFIDSKGRIYDSIEENNTSLFITGYKTSNLLF